jgi:hypothetical protein
MVSSLTSVPIHPIDWIQMEEVNNLKECHDIHDQRLIKKM